MASVLIVDDHQGTLDSYSTALRLAGFETATVSSGEAGIGIASSRNFDVLLIDLRLPDMSGVDVIRDLKRKGVKGRAVIITVFAAFESAFDAASAGADGYVDGMLFGDEVVAVVIQALSGPFPVHYPNNRTRLNLSDAPRATTSLHAGTNPRVREVLQLIDADLAAPRSIAELAEIVGLSESGLRHLFHACAGMSVTAYRHERRLQEAARLIATTHENIRQIAHRIGFSDGSLREFRQAFRERFHMPPTKYRAMFWRGPAREV
jgi:AraC-like DNA-binding protein/CheY-like chemotaxis protein